MKLNWGHYIVIGFTLFVMLILFMVFKSFQFSNELVSEDYYAKELQYQDIIEGKKRAGRLKNDITWGMEEAGLVIVYPEEVNQLSGDILIYRPSDQSLDLQLEIEPDSTFRQVIPMKELKRGKYSVQIHWHTDDVAFYTEGVIFVNK
ncbi:MAG: FixH family protein [Vicingaceae bacterium]